MRRRVPIIRLALVGWFILIALAGCWDDESQPVQAGPISSPNDYPGGQILTTAKWVHDHLADPALRIVDASSLGDYRDGHIPGAVHFWWQDTIEVHNDVYGMLAGEPTRARLLREAGIHPESMVVVYDSSGNRYAARVLWMLHAIGFDRVALLNGGRQAWQAAGYPLSREERTYESGGVPQQLNYDVLIGADEIRTHLDDGTFTIVDNRTPEERRETWYDRLRRGQIPGAVLLPWTELVQAGPVPAYRDPAALRERFVAAGVTPDRPVVVYGLHGVQAAQTYVALTLLGYPSVRVYDGSWADWGARVDLPIAPLPPEPEPVGETSTP